MCIKTNQLLQLWGCAEGRINGRASVIGCVDSGVRVEFQFCRVNVITPFIHSSIFWSIYTSKLTQQFWKFHAGTTS